RIDLLIDAQRRSGDGRATYAVEAVAAGDHVALQLVFGALPAKAHARPGRVDIMHADIAGLEADLPARRQARGDQILHHLLLPVDGDRAPAGQLAERDPLALPFELKVEAVVYQPLARQPLAYARRVQQIDRAL